MPRRSLESLRIAPMPDVAIYPAPPASLTAREGEIWKSITLSRPAGHFDATGRILLAALCAHTAAFERISAEMQRELKTGASDERVWLLTKLRDIEGRAMSSMATRLRLTAQSQHPFSARSATLEGARAAAEKPWETRRPKECSIPDKSHGQLRHQPRPGTDVG